MYVPLYSRHIVHHFALLILIITTIFVSVPIFLALQIVAGSHLVSLNHMWDVSVFICTYASGVIYVDLV